MAPLDRMDPIHRSTAHADKETLMRVTMTEDRVAALDGINATDLRAGVEYDLPEGLAARYLDIGAATTAAAGEQPAGAGPVGEEKALTDPAPENRARSGPRRRK